MEDATANYKIKAWRKILGITQNLSAIFSCSRLRLGSLYNFYADKGLLDENSLSDQSDMLGMKGIYKIPDCYSFNNGEHNSSHLHKNIVNKRGKNVSL